MSNLAEDLFGLKGSQSINSKRKGDKNELNLAKLLAEWTGKTFHRVPKSGGLRWKDNANVVGDLCCEDNSFDFAFSVETKHVASLGLNGPILRKNAKIFTYFAQCERDASRLGRGKLPILIIRENGMPKNEYWVFLRVGSTMFNTFKNKLVVNYVSKDTDLIGFKLSQLMKYPYAQFITFYHEQSYNR